MSEGQAGKLCPRLRALVEADRQLNKYGQLMPVNIELQYCS